MPKPKFTVLTRNKRWISGCVITESVRDGETIDTPSYRRFTASIRGWKGFRIWEGYLSDENSGSALIKRVMDAVRAIRDRIDAGDDSVFETHGTHAVK